MSADLWIVDQGTPKNQCGELEGLFSDDDTFQDETVLSKLRSIFVKPRQTRAVKLGRIFVAVLAPGAGVGANGKVYMSLKQDANFRLRVLGRSAMPYDRYPQAWRQGAPPPNLETFAQDVLAEGIVKDADCSIFGSRGGQVVLPNLWHGLGDKMPPAIVINGGCAMGLPIPCNWPAKAITFLILGGKDYFKSSHHDAEEYIRDSQRHVPKLNTTTALLYIHEMEHMPEQTLLKAVLRKAIEGMVSWKTTNSVPLAVFKTIVQTVRRIGYSVKLLYTCSPGVWQNVEEACGLAASPRLSYPVIHGRVQNGTDAFGMETYSFPHGQDFKQSMAQSKQVITHMQFQRHVQKSQARLVKMIQTHPAVACAPQPVQASQNPPIKVRFGGHISPIMLPAAALDCEGRVLDFSFGFLEDGFLASPMKIERTNHAVDLEDGFMLPLPLIPIE